MPTTPSAAVEIANRPRKTFTPRAFFYQQYFQLIISNAGKVMKENSLLLIQFFTNRGWYKSASKGVERNTSCSLMPHSSLPSASPFKLIKSNKIIRYKVMAVCAEGVYRSRFHYSKLSNAPLPVALISAKFR